MSKIITFEDGTVYVEKRGSRWGRVNMQLDPIQFPGNEVMANAIQDITPPTNMSKGDNWAISLDWFRYLDNFHTSAASNWLWTPNMLWVNRGFVGDSQGNTLANGADPTPRIECITGPLNLLRIIGETTSHYEVFGLPSDLNPRLFNPKVFNFTNYPWIFFKAQARNSRMEVQNVGNNLDVFHMNLRKHGTRHWIHKQHITMFKSPPFIVDDGIVFHNIVDYMFLGVSVYGIKSNGTRIPLLLARKPGEYVFMTDWRCSLGVIPPVV